MSIILLYDNFHVQHLLGFLSEDLYEVLMAVTL